MGDFPCPAVAGLAPPGAPAVPDGGGAEGPGDRLGLDCDGGVAGAPRTRSTIGGALGDGVPGPARRVGASR